MYSTFKSSSIVHALFLAAQPRHSKKTGSSGLKVRTVSELAALVSSGAVRVPQGLEHYVSNRQHLLDQVFTILRPEDVSAMLPDVLKVPATSVFITILSFIYFFYCYKIAAESKNV